MRLWVFILCFSFLFAYSFAYANVVITEIMYDVEGGDVGKEWVEIQNTGALVDLTGWKFFENGVNHGLTVMQGNITLPQNGFSIVADNAEKFLLDWPGFQGNIFDSSFSLSNTGETLILRNTEISDIDSVAYSSDWGANGNGKSLQKADDGWVTGVPTPGEKSSGSVSGEVPPSLQRVVGGDGEDSAVGSGSTPEPKPSPFQAFAGEDKSMLSGAEVYFEGQVKGVEENMIEKTRFFWNFGDGITGEGRNIKHIFQYPGTYIVNLDVSLDSFSDSDVVKVSVSPASIFFSEIKPGNFLEIKNDSVKLVDISSFGLQIDSSKIFNFQKNTILSPNSYLAIDSLTLGFEVPDNGEVKILYPNGKILISLKYESGILSEKESISFDGGKWVKSQVTPGAKNIIKKELVVASTATPKMITKASFNSQQQKISPSYEVVARGDQEASVINSSLWSEIKWLVFGLGVGVVTGVMYIFLRRHFGPVSAL